MLATEPTPRSGVGWDGWLEKQAECKRSLFSSNAMCSPELREVGGETLPRRLVRSPARQLDPSSLELTIWTRIQPGAQTHRHVIRADRKLVGVEQQMYVRPQKQPV